METINEAFESDACYLIAGKALCHKERRCSSSQPLVTSLVPTVVEAVLYYSGHTLRTPFVNTGPSHCMGGDAAQQVYGPTDHVLDERSKRKYFFVKQTGGRPKSVFISTVMSMPSSFINTLSEMPSTPYAYRCGAQIIDHNIPADFHTTNTVDRRPKYWCHCASHPHIHNKSKGPILHRRLDVSCQCANVARRQQPRVDVLP